MDFRENDTDSKEIQINTDFIKIPIYYKDEKYTIKINPSKDNNTINFKLEKDKIQTYYFYDKFDMRDFKQKNKLFINDKNIKDIFIKLKDICKKYFINLEIKGNKICIIFKNIDTNIVFKFALKKKIVKQERLNPLLEEQIGDNKAKLNILKNQMIKCDKSLHIKNDILNTINTSLPNLNSILNNISIINTSNNINALNTASTKNSSSNESNSENNSNNNNEDEYQDAMNDSDNTGQYYQNTNQKQDSTNNNNNNKKDAKDNKNNNTNNNNSNNSNNNNLDTFFCFEKNDPSQNKKIIELLIIFNVVTIIIVLYMLSSVYNFRLDFENIDENEEDDDNKYTYLSFVNNAGNDNQNFRDIFQEDLEQLTKGDDGITSSAIKEDYMDKKKRKNNERYVYYSNNLY